MDLLKKIGRVPLCNEIPERAPHIGGFCFPLCWRCTAFIIGIIISHLIIPDGAGLKKGIMIIIGMSLIVPCLLDGIMQYLLSKPSNNIRRFTSGFLAGIGTHIVIDVLSAIALNWRI